MALEVDQATGQGSSATTSERFWTLAFALLLPVGLLGYGNMYLLVPTIPRYIDRLGGTHSDLGVVMGLFSLTSLLMRPVAGALSDRFGSKAVLALGAGGMGLVNLAYLPTASVAGAMVVRSLHGLGWGVFSVAGSTMAAEITPPGRRGEALSLFGMMGGLGLALGPVIGDAVGAGDESFLLAAAAGIVSLALTLAIPLPGSDAERSRQGRTSLFTRGALLPAAVTLTFMATYGAVFTFVPVLTQQRGMGGAGWFFTPYALGMVLSRTFTGRLSDRYGRTRLIAPGMVLAACGLALLGASDDRIALAAAALLYSGAFAAVQPICLAWATDRSRPEDRGAGIATALAAQDLGISLGSFAAGLVADAAGLGFLFSAAVAVALGGFVLVVAAARRPVRANQESR